MAVEQNSTSVQEPQDLSQIIRIDEGEKDGLIRDYSQVYTFDGIAFYAWQ